VSAFVDGSANFLRAMGFPVGIATALMGVLVASFAGTTMDSACRLQRYVVQELAGALTFSASNSAEPRPRAVSAFGPLALLRNKHGATIFSIGLAALLAAVPLPGQSWSLDNAGKGGLLLWPLFGATNQLLGGLSFLVIAFYLWRRKKPVWFIIIPMIFMLIMPMWAMIVQVFIGTGGAIGWIHGGNWVLTGIGLATIALEIWMILEALSMFPRAKGVLEAHALDQFPQGSAMAKSGVHG
jgi:carbon starvation protein